MKEYDPVEKRVSGENELKYAYAMAAVFAIAMAYQARMS